MPGDDTAATAQADLSVLVPVVVAPEVRLRARLHRLTRPSVSVLTVIVALAAIPVAIVYARPLHTAPNYDEDVYLATMRELHHGTAIGTVFLSQPPGFGWLLDAMATVTGSLVGIRSIMIGIALLGCLGAWFLGRRAGGAVGGAVAAATLAIAPPWTVVASRLEAETPSLTFAIGALALAACELPFLAGVAFAVAVSLKLLVVSAALPLVLLARRRLKSLLLGAAAATLVIGLSVARHLHEVWAQAVTFHTVGRKTIAPSTGANTDRVVHFLSLHQPFGLVVVGSLVVAVAEVVRRAPLMWELWAWPPAASLTLILQRPLFDHHMALLGAAWAIPAGVTLGGTIGRARSRDRITAVAAMAALTVGGLYQQWGELSPQSEPTNLAAAVARLRTIAPPGSLVATDYQLIPYLAGDREPPNLVDLSNVRMQSGELTLPELLRQSADVRAFVVGRSLATNEPVLGALSRRYRTRIDIGSITIFTNPRR